MAHARRGCGIRGRGAVATSLALALGQQGLRVALSAAAAVDPARPDVRAYALNAASRRLLQRLKVWDALPDDAVTPVYDMQVRGDRPAGRSDVLGVDASASTRWRGSSMRRRSSARSTPRCSSPRMCSAATSHPPRALTVYAEGKDSAAREALGVQFDRHGYGQTAIAARLVAADVAPRRGAPVVPLARRAGAAAVRSAAAERSFALVWSLPQERAAELMHMDARPSRPS